ncbi:hypothetical protein [Streptomyces sp. NPDC058542]|uniref:hypothetical protein n=1 Tax=Streptomyces sp. NPDC058542 TaxID=3346543 RepID=UPI00366860DA
MPALPRLLSLGDRVRYDGREHTVAALHGTSVRLVDDAQAASVVLLGHLLASEAFTVLSTALSRPPLPEAGVLEGLPEEAAQRAKWWRRHLTELLTGHPDGDGSGPVRAEYDPTVHSLRQRELAKVAEPRDCGEAVGLSTLRRMRSRFESEGVAGLVDGRLRKPATGTSRADPRAKSWCSTQPCTGAAWHSPALTRTSGPSTQNSSGDSPTKAPSAPPPSRGSSTNSA